MAIVIDASVMFAAGTAPDGFQLLREQDLAAPPLLWPETRSALHVARWRGLISPAAAEQALSLLHSGPVRERRHRRLGPKAWAIADELEWAKTYDAEYLALASLLAAPIVTLDRRLARAARRLDVAVFELDL